MLRGMIILWYGAVVDIPDGWILCDGDNGTPDLTDRFVVGAGDTYAVDDSGGAVNHAHDFTGDGHVHWLGEGFEVQAGSDFSVNTTDNPAVGTTDNEDGRPPYYALAYIMKVRSDPDPRDYLPWPYAAKAIIEHAWISSVLYIYITFRHKMNTDNTPAINKWFPVVDSVPKNAIVASWLDQWTLRLIILAIPSPPATVTLKYDGPDDDLATVWDKQWEPWGYIPSIELKMPPGTKTFSTGPAQQDDVDVANISVLFLNCAANDITIGGFINGVNGQVLHIARLCAAVNDATLKHAAISGNQDILLHKGADETLTGEYGGWTLACNGTNWYDISHAKHV